jgi:hypothetical protein
VRINAFYNLDRRSDNRVYPSIKPESREGPAGCLEEIGPMGIRGWLLDCGACDTHLKVDSYLDGHVLGSGYANRPRPDISEIVGRPISCEFLIPWSAMTLPPELKGMESTAKLQIRVVAAESGREIAAANDSDRTVGQLLDYATDKSAGMLAQEFDAAFYLAANADVAASGLDPLEHYCSYGWREGRRPSPTFDISWYLATNPDVAASGVDPFQHWLVAGRAEGRLPISPHAVPLENTDEEAGRIATIRTEFSERYYLSQNPDVAAAGIDPLKHYYQHGWREGRNPNATFDSRYYLDANPDVRNAGLNPFWHYLVFGRKESRPVCRPGGYRRRIIDAARTPDQRAKDYVVPPAELVDSHVLTDHVDAALAGAVGLVVSLSHDCYIRVIGGTQIFIADERQRFAERHYAYIHLSPRRARLGLASLDETFEVQIVVDGTFIGIATLETCIAVLGDRLTGVSKPRMLVVHSVLGFNEEQILNLRTALAPSRSVFWLHDYTSLCEGFNLLRNDLTFCNAPPPDSMACRICVYGGNRAHHMERMERLFERCDFDVLSPSVSTLDLWSSRTALPFASAAVYPHSNLARETVDEATTAQQLADAELRPIRIGFVGYPSPGKGWPIFSALFDEFHTDPRYHFVHLAARDVATIPECEFVVTESTPDDRDATTRLLHEHRIDFLAMLSPWPETFSFVAHEAIAAGCLLLCFRDSGNVAALVRRTGLGEVFDDAAALRAFFAGSEAVAVASHARARPHRFQLIHSGTTATVKRFFQEEAAR